MLRDEMPLGEEARGLTVVDRIDPKIPDQLGELLKVAKCPEHWLAMVEEILQIVMQKTHLNAKSKDTVR